MIDPLSVNVTNLEGALLCPVCGFPGYSTEPAYSRNGGEIGKAICPCCLWEPGFDDCPAASAQAKDDLFASILDYRRRWSATKEWRGHRHLLPKGFDGLAQLNQLFKIAPHLK